MSINICRMWHQTSIWAFKPLMLCQPLKGNGGKLNRISNKTRLKSSIVYFIVVLTNRAEPWREKPSIDLTRITGSNVTTLDKKVQIDTHVTKICKGKMSIFSMGSRIKKVCQHMIVSAILNLVAKRDFFT